MKTSEKELRIKVNYINSKGESETFILNPGHKVYELNLNTGVVSEALLESNKNIIVWLKDLRSKHRTHNIVRTGPHLLHIPAYDLHKAKTMFKHMTKNLGIKIK